MIISRYYSDDDDRGSSRRRHRSSKRRHGDHDKDYDRSSDESDDYRYSKKGSHHSHRYILLVEGCVCVCVGVGGGGWIGLLCIKITWIDYTFFILVQL